MFYRFLTLQEANAFLPLLKERLSHIQALIVEGQLLQEALKESPALNAPLQEAPQKPDRLLQIEDQIRNEIMQMGQWGIFVKSVFPPKVDFLSKRHQQPIFLSWKRGERQVSHWHFLEEGFSLRKPIVEKDAFLKEVIH